MRIAFIWQGFDGRYGQWNDGLRAAMRIIEQEHEVMYLDFPLRVADLVEFNPDAVLYWEAPTTINGKDATNYRTVCELPYRKFLLFAGGPINPMWVKDFELLFVESRVNEEECERFGIPYKRAFGVNTQVMKPQMQPKVFHGALPATCASWKRHWLLADALHDKAVFMGRYQQHDPMGFDRAHKAGSLVLPELSAEGVASILNASYTMVNTSDVWGGGQRATLEAMACGVPPVVMEDSPKNREFVEESDFGYIVPPDSSIIAATVGIVVANYGVQDTMKGVQYIESKWTESHYAKAILDGIRA